LGRYSIWIDGEAVSNGTTVYIRELDPNGYISTGDSKNGTVDSNSNANLTERNTLEYTMQAGETYENWNFGDVRVLEIYRDHSVVIAPGKSASIHHQITIHTPGSVDIYLDKPDNFSIALLPDSDCDGKDDGYFLKETDGFFNLGQDLAPGSYCFILKAFVPSNIGSGGTYPLTVWAYEDWKNTEGINGETDEIYDDMNFVLDTFVVSAGYSGGMLRLIKEVRNESKDEEFTTSNEAEPGDTLEYRITFKNISSQTVKKIVIADTLPLYTKLKVDAYGTQQDVKLEIDNNTYYGTADTDDADGDGVGIFGNTLMVDIEKLTDGVYYYLPSGIYGMLYYKVKINTNTNIVIDISTGETTTFTF